VSSCSTVFLVMPVSADGLGIVFGCSTIKLVVLSITVPRNRCAKRLILRYKPLPIMSDCTLIASKQSAGYGG